MSVPLDLVAWLVQERYIISLFHAARALHASLVEEYVKIGCLPSTPVGGRIMVVLFTVHGEGLFYPQVPSISRT